MRYHKNVTYEVEVKTVVRDEKGKIRRILRVWGSDPTLQRFTHFGEDPPREEFKKAARRRQPLSIDPFKNYTPAEVAGILNISYDSSLRQMEKMGAVDMGTPETLHKRRKRMLRVTGKRLMDYLRKRSLGLS
jgi:hypothetical protein